MRRGGSEGVNLEGVVLHAQQQLEGVIRTGKEVQGPAEVSK